MIPFAAAVAAVLILTGLFLLVGGGRRPADAAPTRTAPGLGTVRRLTHLPGSRTRALLAGGAVAGLLTWLLTGWAVAVIVFPALVVGAPLLLLRSDEPAAIGRLEALQEWTRGLASTVRVGGGIENTIVKTGRSVPEPIRDEVGMLISRINAGVRLPTALRAFAADINDDVGDQIAYRLLLGSSKRGEGLSVVLTQLADSVARTVRMRRDTETDRGKTRTSARWITLIGVAVIAALFLFRRSYIDAGYKSPIGQLILLLLLAAYAACLVWLHRAAAGRKPPRLFGTRLETAGSPQ